MRSSPTLPVIPIYEGHGACQQCFRSSDPYLASWTIAGFATVANADMRGERVQGVFLHKADREARHRYVCTIASYSEEQEGLRFQISTTNAAISPATSAQTRFEVCLFPKPLSSKYPATESAMLPAKPKSVIVIIIHGIGTAVIYCHR